MKNLRLVLLLLIGFLTFNNQAFAQSGEGDENNYTHSIGLAAGWTTGYGISYRFQPQKFGVQLTFAPYADRDTKRFSTGLTFLYNLIKSRYTNLYLYQGNHFLYDSYSYIDYDANGNMFSRSVTNRHWFNGIGVGIEFIIAKRIGLNLMGGYAGFENFARLSVTGEAGLFYKF